MEALAKKYSQGYSKDVRNNTQYTFWSKDFDGMAYKTMLRQLISKWGIMSIDMQTAFDADMAVIREDNTYDYVDNQPEVVADVPAEAVAEPESDKQPETVKSKARTKKEAETGSETVEATTTGVQQALFGAVEG